MFHYVKENINLMHAPMPLGILYHLSKNEIVMTRSFSSHGISLIFPEYLVALTWEISFPYNDFPAK